MTRTIRQVLFSSLALAAFAPLGAIAYDTHADPAKPKAASEKTAKSSCTPMKEKPMVKLHTNLGVITIAVVVAAFNILHEVGGGNRRFFLV